MKPFLQYRYFTFFFQNTSQKQHKEGKVYFSCHVGECMLAGTWGSTLYCICAQEAERNEFCLPSSFLLFIQSRTVTHGMVRVGLPTLMSPTQKLIHRHAQSFVSYVILDPTKLTLVTNTVSLLYCQRPQNVTFFWVSLGLSPPNANSFNIYSSSLTKFLLLLS